MRALLLLSLLGLSLAGESCCARKARLAKLQFIPDESEQPPDFDAAGNPRMIPDPDEEKPAEWDDDDDGPWEPADIENPEYNWTSRLVPNPEYKPPSFLNELAAEIFKALPWVVLGIAITAVLEAVQLPMHTLAGLLRGAGPLGGAALGLAVPLCSCGALPVAAGLVASGVPLGAVVAFLTASQSSGLDSAAVTWGLLGPLATACRLVGAIVLATVAGFAAGAGGSALAAKGDAATVEPRRASSAAACKRPAFHRALGRAAVSSASESFPPVFLGLALSTAATHWLPIATAYESLAGGAEGSALRTLLVRCAVLLAALPLQLCEHSTVTLAAGVQKAGGGAGLAFALLLAAPAVNLPSLLLLATPRVKGGGASAYAHGVAAGRVAVALVVVALVLSYAVDAAGVDLLVAREADSAQALNTLPAPLVTASPWIAALLSLAALAPAVARRARGSAPRTHGESCCDVNGQREALPATTVAARRPRSATRRRPAASRSRSPAAKARPRRSARAAR